MSKNINFELLNLPISDLITSYSIEKQEDIFNYLNEMDEYNKIAYKIAFTNLGNSYNIYKSNGFNDWLKSKTK